MRIVVASNQFPLPPDSGGPIRIHALAKTLAESHKVHLLALRREGTTPELVIEMEAVTGGPVEVFSPSGEGGFGRRWVSALIVGTPPFVQAEHSQELALRLRELAADADAVVFLDDYAGGYAEAVAGRAPVILDKHNVLAWSMRESGSRSGVKARLRHSTATNLMRRFEGRSVARAQSVVVTSDEESRRLERLYGRRADAVVPGAVDLPDRPAALGGDRVAAWLGLHAYEPNVEGLVRFVEEGWEPLSQQGWRLLVAGSNPPDRVRALERFPGIELLGFVETLDDLYARSCAAVVPLWAGAGVKLKTLTFMAAGVPVAGTPVALEGIEVQDGRHCLVADDPRDLADALRRIGDDRALSDRLAREGRALVAETHTWQGIAPRFVDAVEQASATNQL